MFEKLKGKVFTIEGRRKLYRINPITENLEYLGVPKKWNGSSLKLNYFVKAEKQILENVDFNTGIKSVDFYTALKDVIGTGGTYASHNSELLNDKIDYIRLSVTGRGHIDYSIISERPIEVASFKDISKLSYTKIEFEQSSDTISFLNDFLNED